MGSAGRLEANVTVQATTEIFYKNIREYSHIIPSFGPDDYLKSDGKSVGSDRDSFYVVPEDPVDSDEDLENISWQKITVVDETDGDLLKYYKESTTHITGIPKYASEFADDDLDNISTEKITVMDETTKSVSYSVIAGDLLKYYKVFTTHITVTPKDGGSSVKWVCEYEKVHEEIPNPDAIKDFVVKNSTRLMLIFVEEIPNPDAIKDFVVKTFHKIDAYIRGA